MAGIRANGEAPVARHEASYQHAGSSITFDPANSGFTATNAQDAIDELNEIVATGSGANPQGTWLVSGGGVAWLTGYTFAVSAAQYYIMGVAYTSPNDSVTLSAADATFDRFDIIAVNSSGAVVVLEGTPAAAPELPDVDPQTQLSLTIIRVDALSTEPGGVTNVLVYDENAGEATEFTGATSDASVVLGSTNDAYSGTKSIEGTSVANGVYFHFYDAAAFDVTVYETLAFAIKSKASWPKTKSIAISFRDSSNIAYGTQVALANGFFGFDSSDTSNWQNIIIPLGQFNLAAGQEVDRVRFQISGGGSSIGFYVDDIRLQGGTSSDGGSGITLDQADARYAQRAANLSDLTDAATARTSLGLGTAAVEDATAFLGDIVDDTSPQLGGDLDANGNTIHFGTAENEAAIATGPSPNTCTVDLSAENHWTIPADDADDSITATITVPPGPTAGSIIVVQGGTGRDITWSPSAGTVKWLGTEPTWADDTSVWRIVGWRWDGTYLYLWASESGG